MSGTLIVTGASRGIGAAIARLAATRGYRVCLTATTSIAEAEGIALAIRAAGGNAIALRCDVAREDEVVGMFETSERELGPVTGLVNNAGITGRASRVDGLTHDDIAQCFAVNVFGSMIAAREAVRRMSTRNGGRGGVIVNISSQLAVYGGAGEFVPYATCKGAINSFTIGLAREVATEGVRVNAVSPGVIETTIHPEGRIARLLPMVPMQRPGTPEEVAELTVWLLSDAASYITGAIMPVSGGR